MVMIQKRAHLTFEHECRFFEGRPNLLADGTILYEQKDRGFRYIIGLAGDAMNIGYCPYLTIIEGKTTIVKWLTKEYERLAAAQGKGVRG